MYYRLLQKLNVNDFFHFFHHYTFWASSLIAKIYMLFHFRPMWIDTVCLPSLEFTPRDGLKMAHIFHHKLSRRRGGYMKEKGKRRWRRRRNLRINPQEGRAKWMLEAIILHRRSHPIDWKSCHYWRKVDS